MKEKGRYSMGKNKGMRQRNSLTMVVKKPGRPREFNIDDETTTASSGNSETISGNEDN